MKKFRIVITFIFLLFTISINAISHKWYDDIIDTTLNHYQGCSFGFVVSVGLEPEYSVFYYPESNDLVLNTSNVFIFSTVFNRFKIVTQGFNEDCMCEMNIISLNDSIMDVDYVLSQTIISITRSCLKIDKQLLMELESKFLDPKIAKHKTSIEYMSRSNNVKIKYYNKDGFVNEYDSGYITNEKFMIELEKLCVKLKEAIQQQDLNKLNLNE